MGGLGARLWIFGGSVVAAALLGWWLGTNHVEGKWAKADNAALMEQVRLYDEAIEERDLLQARIDTALFRLTESEERRLELSRELQEAIDREPIIRTETREVPANCPVCSFPVVDTIAHYRLWNAALTLDFTADTPTLNTGFGNGPLWGSGFVAGMDGIGGLNERRRTETLGEGQP